MAQTIKLKRSSTGGAVPSTSSLSLGEVAINTYDGKMYIKKNDGTDSIVQIGAGSGSAVWNSYDYTATSSQTSFSGNDNNSESLSYVPGFLQVFLNGILLDPAVDYVATTGSSIVLTVGASTSDLIQIETFTQIIGTGDILVDTFPVSSTQTAFTLSQDPINKNNISVYVEGVYQESSTYSLSTTTLTLSESPANGTTVEVVIGTRNVTLDNIADLTISGTLHAGALDLGDANIINVNEISLDTIKGDADANTNITFAGSDVTTFTQGGQERLRLNTTGAEVTGNIVVSGTVDGRDVAADGVTADAALSRAGGAMGGPITTSSTFDGRDVSVDGTKLDGIESGATADQTDVEIRAAVASASDSNVFTNADHSKLNAIEALADVTDATNVTAAGALMKAGGTMTGALTGTTAAFNSGGTNVVASFTSTDTIGAIQLADNAGNVEIGAVGNDFHIMNAGGAAKMVVKSDGNVGIGTTNPQRKLVVYQGDSGQAQIQFQNVTTGSVAGDGFGVGLDSNEKGFIWNYEGNDTYIGGAGGTSITIQNGGNVGIGDTNPGYKLSVVNGTSDGSILKLGNEEVGLIVAIDGTTASPTYTGAPRTVVFNATRLDSGTPPKLRLGGQGGLEFAADANNVKMVIDSSGNVGIGTTSPSSKLDVQQATAGNIISAEFDNTDYTANNRNAIKIRQQVNSSGSYSAYLGSDKNTGNVFLSNDSITANHLVINTSGNVGIGTTNPTGYRLVLENTSEDLLKLHNSTNGLDSLISFTNPGGTLGRVQGIDNGGLGFDVGNNAGGIISNAIRIANTGNVGIGTTSPADKLHISGGHILLNNALEIRTKDTGGNTRTIMRANSSNELEYGWSANAPVKFMGGGAYTERMRIHTNGNVGIGTTSPNYKLEVDGTLRTTGTVTLNGANLDLRADNARLLIEEADGTDITWLGDHTGGGHGGLYLYNHGGTATVKLTADSHANYINNGNNFGIGTSAPAARLHVYTTGYPSGKFERYGTSTATRGWTQIGHSALGYSGSTGADSYLVSQNGFGFAVNEGTTALVITDGGKVGIGTANPAETLEVDGSIRVGNLKIQPAFAGRIGFNRNTANGAIYNSGYSAVQINGPATSNPNYMAFETYNSSGGNGTVAMVIQEGGNIGIGTTGPAKKLHVRNTADGTLQRFTRQGVCDWDVSIGNTPIISGGSSGDLEIMPQNANMGFAVGRAGQTGINMRVRDGVMTLGSGIKFNGDTAAANELDDYEEGTWTALMTDTGGNQLTMVARSCRYTKIGRMVHIYGVLTTTSLASASGNLRVHGLPYTAASDWDDTAGVHISHGSGLNITAGQTLTGWVHPNGAYFNLQIWNTAVGTNYMTTGEWSANGSCFFSGHYSVA